jgi:hypothetical protein
MSVYLQSWEIRRYFGGECCGIGQALRLLLLPLLPRLVLVPLRLALDDTDTDFSVWFHLPRSEEGGRWALARPSFVPTDEPLPPHFPRFQIKKDPADCPRERRFGCDPESE